jgi:hypothetical protein
MAYLASVTAIVVAIWVSSAAYFLGTDGEYGLGLLVVSSLMLTLVAVAWFVVAFASVLY